MPRETPTKVDLDPIVANPAPAPIAPCLPLPGLPLPDEGNVTGEIKNSTKKPLKDWLIEKSRQVRLLHYSYPFLMCGLQKIIYLLENNPDLLENLKDNLETAVSSGDELMAIIQHYLESVHSIHNDALQKNRTKLNNLQTQDAQLKEGITIIQSAFDQLGTIDESTYVIDALYNLLNDGINKITGENLDSLISKDREEKTHFSDPENFSHITLEQYGRYLSCGYSTAELEYRLLLHEDIHDHTTSRFSILNEICNILRPFREQIKDIIHNITKIANSGAPIPFKDARIKFRGSLVRGLKGYPKYGVAPTLDNYDCDAFIEVPDDVWDILKKHNTYAVSDVDERASVKPLRDYESLEGLKVGVSRNRPKPKTMLFQARERAIQAQIVALQNIEEIIKQEILKAKKDGRLAGYSVTGDTPDFEFYIRPVSAVKKAYAEGNPYIKPMVEQRGVALLAASLPSERIFEFECDTEHRRKRPVLATFFLPDDTQPEGVIMPEIEVVVGKHSWYFEDQQLFEWRLGMRITRDPHAVTDGAPKLDASRRNLRFYSEEFLPLPQRSYEPEDAKEYKSETMGEAKASEVSAVDSLNPNPRSGQGFANELHRRLQHFQSKFFRSHNAPGSIEQGSLAAAFLENGRNQKLIP